MQLRLPFRGPWTTADRSLRAPGRSVHSSFLAVAFRAVFFLVCLAPGAVAQEIGASRVVASSDHVEFPGPSGASVHVLVPLAPGWYARLALNQLSDETAKVGSVCVNYTPRVGCTLQDTRTETELSGFRGGIMRALSFGEALRVGAGAGLSFNQLDVDARGPSGQQADILAPNGGQIGGFGLLSVTWRPLPGVPLQVNGGLTGHWVRFHSCSGETPPRYDPFCDPGTFRELDLGVGYAF